MNYSKYRFNLDMQSYISQVSLPVRQHDTGIILRINLTDGGVPYVIRDGCRAVFYARKSDGNPLMNDCIIEKNTTICYELTQQTTACSGVVDCEVRLYGSDGNLITTPRFILVIDSRVVHDEDFPLSDAEQTVLDNIILSEQARIKAEEEREIASAEALAKAEQAEELVDELIERLAVEDIGDEELRIHNENSSAHPNAFNAHNEDMEAHNKLFGEGNEKGIKGYWIKSVSLSQNCLLLSPLTDRASVGAPTLSSSIVPTGTENLTGYAVGDEFSIITPKNHHILCGKITDIKQRAIYYELYPEADEINWSAGDPIDDNDYSFCVPEKYDVGIITVSEGGLPTGSNNVAGGYGSLTAGNGNKVIGNFGFTAGQGNIAGYGARANGRNTKALGMDSATDGFGTKAKGSAAYAGGVETEADGYGAFATNIGTKAKGKGAVAVNYNTEADGEFSFSAGGNTKAKGKYSVALGESSEASGSTSFAHGFLAKALNSFAQAFGWRTEASGTASAVFGSESQAKGSYSFAANKGTIANGEAQAALGKFNKENPNAYLIVGNGTSNTDRSNALEVLKDGTIVTSYGLLTHNVNFTYTGTGSDVTTKELIFDVLPDILVMIAPHFAIIFPKVGVGFIVSGQKVYPYNEFIVAGNNVTLKTLNIYDSNGGYYPIPFNSSSTKYNGFASSNAT